MTKRGLLLWFVTVALLTSAMPSWAAPGTTPSGPKAGSITALLPTAHITRGSGKKAVTTDAKKGDELVWNDLVKTDKGGRARITLADQSILSLGSQAELRIVKHDARAQQTALEMAYGRVRAQVANITRDGGNFELRTPTAVAGVIGTDFGVDSSSVGGDTFVCIAGAVQVSNSNKTVAGSVQCTAGQTTTVQPGKPPSPPQPASPQQIQQLIADTEPAIIASINPASSLPGANFDATIAGQNMASINGASISGTGVTVTFKTAAAAGVTVHVAIDANAAPGPRTITLTKPSGTSSATVFSVQGAPSGDKQSYLTTLQQLAATGSTGLGGLVTGAQQSADQIAQAVTNANLNLKKPIDLTGFATALNQNYTQLQTQLQGQNATVQTAAQNAATQFGTAFDTANTSLQQGKVSQTDYQAAIAKAFTDANTAIQTAITGAQNTLNGQLQTYASTLNQLQTDWFTQINAASAGGPAPKVNALERDVNLGDSATFDASGSSATNGASIQSTNWVLCAPSYQPNGFGTPLDSSAAACTPLQGAGAVASTQSDITIPTCALNAGNYYVRLTLTDTNGKVTPMDVKMVVIAPTYGTPTQTLQGLASAYESRQYGPYASYFDPNASGIATYLNNVQQTLPTLNSMSVHIISSQDSIDAAPNCNTASTYATWQLNYSYTNNPGAVLQTIQPLQVTMRRAPGTGWLITNVVAQNGLQQGAIAGPLNTNTASPDLVISGASIDSTALDPNTSFPVTSGASHIVQVSVMNVGAANLGTAMPLEVDVVDATNTIIATTTLTIPALASNATTSFMATVAVPAEADGVKLTLRANVNPGCTIAEQNCDSKNQASFPLTVTNFPDLAFGAIQTPPIQFGGSYTLNVPVVNNGGSALAGWTLVASVGGQQVATITGPAVPAVSTVTIPVTFTVPPAGAAPQDTTVPFTLTISGVTKEVITNNNTFSGSVRLVDFALAVVPTTPQTAVVGRSFSLTATSVSPSPYPLQLAVNYANLPAGLTGNGFIVSGTPTAAGVSSVTASGTADGVTHAASGSISIAVQPEITLVQSTTPALNAGDPAQPLTIAVAGGIYPVTLTITLPPGITTADGTINGNVSTQTITSAQSVTWNLKADFTANTGNLTIPVVATDAGFTGTATPAGNVPLSAKYGVTANANYVITSAAFAGRTAPYTGANALQFGESTQLVLTIANQGNGSPTGTVTVSANCNGTNCNNPTVGTFAAPAVGTPITVTLPINNINQPVGSYIGTATLTTNVSGAVVGPAFTLPFDVVDFTISVAPSNLFTPAQNLPIGGTGMICVDVSEQLASGTAFPVLITPSAPAAGVTFMPASQSASGNCIPFTANVAGSVTQSSSTPDTITVSAANRGVMRSLAMPINVNYYNAQLASLGLFVNNSGNPLTVPVATSAGAPTNTQTLNLQMTGNFVGGAAQNLTTVATCGSYAALPQTSASLGQTVNWPIYAAAGTNCPATTQIAIQATIPNTNPSTAQTIYTLYVAPKGLAQLQVISVTPPAGRDLTAQPWLAGEPMDWTVTVKNVGSGTSVGNEKVMLSLNGMGGQVGTGLLSPIAPNGTGQVVVHTDAPDFPGTGSASYTLSTHVVLDTQGDLAPGTGDTSQTVTVANWGISVNGAGASGNPVTLTVGGGSTTANVVVNALSSGTFNPNIMLPMVLGSYNSTQLNASTFSPSSISSSGGTTVTLSLQNGQSPPSGSYFVQVIAQMKDGATVTAQRQATIQVTVSNISASAAFILLGSDQNNLAACPNGVNGCAATNPVQINGPLPASVTLTATVSGCSPGTCPSGNVDVSFTDSMMTTTTPPVSTIGVSSPGNTLPIRVKAATNPDGSINTGNATVYASVSAIQAGYPSSARTPNPDPVGTDNFAMAYNVGDIQLTVPTFCMGVIPQNPSSTTLQTSKNFTPASMQPAWSVIAGFNAPTLSWEWEDANHLMVSGMPLSFSQSSGTSNYTSGSYTALPVFTLTNGSTGIDGLQTYYLAVTVSNGLATATKYFPFTFDLSQSQTFCPPGSGAARGMGGGQLIRGSWGKTGLLAVAHAAVRSSGRLPDVRISSTDVSFTPSMPKTGDVVSVRFRVSNVGDVNATAVPIGLQVNGAVVASDTFDVPVGKTVLGALQWNNAQIPTASVVTPGRAASSRLMRPTRGGGPIAAPVATSVLNALNAAIVIDPQQKTQQKSTLAKSAALAHFSLHDGTAASTLAAAGIARQRVVLELGEGGCAGLRFAGGIVSCGGADVSFSVEDLAKGLYTLQATNGIVDLGTASLQTTSANVAGNFSPQAVGQSGHTYAVQLRGGSVAMFTLTAVRNPNQLSEAAQRVFRGPAARVISRLGKNTAAPEPATTQESKVYFDIVYQGQ